MVGDAPAYSNVLAGTYELEVQATGFKTSRRTGIQVIVNTVRREDVQLEVG